MEELHRQTRMEIFQPQPHNHAALSHLCGLVDIQTARAEEMDLLLEEAIHFVKPLSDASESIRTDTSRKPAHALRTILLHQKSPFSVDGGYQTVEHAALKAHLLGALPLSRIYVLPEHLDERDGDAFYQTAKELTRLQHDRCKCAVQSMTRRKRLEFTLLDILLGKKCPPQ